MPSPTIVWFRRDLRVHDNLVLAQAAADGPVVCVFILDEQLLGNSPQRSAFLVESLVDLDARLHELGSRLVVCPGDPFKVLYSLCDHVGAWRVVWSADNGRYGAIRDQDRG